MEKVGFSVISKEVKWTPVLLNQQNHFKEVVKKLFDVLDNVKNTNSELSNKLYVLTRKIKKLQNLEEENISEEELKEIFELIEGLDGDLKNLNIDIGNLQDSLKKPAYRRKCDFDVEITRDALNMIDSYDTLLLFSGDGDYFALTEDLIKKGKKVILVFAEGHKGKEYNSIGNSLFYACSVDNLENSIKK
ncbi:NYN domain-containing protein [Patescibacteria group bacterium]|nr:NYN domain-containing protein [Patescibacteria group bacterium]MBU4580527.1 NYN domain-containing protein [Patescibacteria group bacterium]